MNKKKSLKSRLLYIAVLFYPFIEELFLYIGRTQGFVTFKLMYFVVILMCIWLNKSENKGIIKASSFFIVIYSVFFLIYQVCFLKEKLSSDTLSFVFFTVFLLMASNDEFIDEMIREIICQKRLITVASVFYLVILVLSILDGRGITGTWGIISLSGPYSLNHDFAYTLTVLFCLFSFLYRNKGGKIYFTLKWCFALLLITTGVRSAAIGLFILICFDFKKLSRKKKIVFLLLGIALFLILAGTTDIIHNNPLVQKNESAAATGNVTNGRVDFWRSDIEFYLQDTGIIEKLLGCGIGAIRTVNFQTYNMDIQAHNDFLNILIGYGLIGIIYSIYLIKKYLKHVSGLLLLFILVLALTNGFVMYSIVFSIPILKIFFMNDNIEK